MAWKNAGGRYTSYLTGSLQKITGSMAAYLNRPVDPRCSVVEVICYAVIAAGAVGLAYAVNDPTGAMRFRLFVRQPPGPALAYGMGLAAMVHLGLLYLLVLPDGARVAGALLAATTTGAVLQVLVLAKAPVEAVLAALVLAPAVMVQLRCRTGWLPALGLSGAAGFLLAMLKDYLR